jgi:DNA-binding NarL/FixJ family response regulator
VDSHVYEALRAGAGVSCSRARRPVDVGRLTERELEVLHLMARGQSTAEMDVTLVVSEAIVKTHVALVPGKLELRDRVQAVVKSYEHGLIRPGAEPTPGWCCSA